MEITHKDISYYEILDEDCRSNKRKPGKGREEQSPH